MTPLPDPAPLSPAELRERAARVRLLLLDVDGVLTDGRIVYSSGPCAEEIETKAFHVRDGSGLKLWHEAGNQSAILSGRSSATVTRRAGELGIGPVVQGCPDKRDGYRTILTQLGVGPDRVCAVGDDLPDLPVLLRCGLAVAVADACDEVKRAAHWVTPVPGGLGAVRATVEWLLTLRGEWSPRVDHYRKAG